MTKKTASTGDELLNLQNRVRNLAMEKSYLQLIVRLITRLSTAPGLENTVDNMLKCVVDVIGGTNLILYYRLDNDLVYADLYGKRQQLEEIEDELVKQVFTTREPLEVEHAFADTRMQTPEFTPAYTWVYPLQVGSELVGVFKMEGLSIGMRELYGQLPIFFNYAALVLKNEISGHSRLQQAYAELARANEQLRELDRLKSMFIASMSHELRTPLNAVIGFTGIMLQGMDGELNHKQQEHLERVQKSGKHLLALINDVIDISKIEAGRSEVVTSKFALAEVIGEAVDSIRIQAEGKGLNLQVELPEGVMLVSDRRRLLQCLLNFLSNALKFTELGGITVTTQALDEEVEVAVSDTGIGIAEEDLPKLFQAFERIESRLKVKAGGTGLGLYLTRKIADELLGGGVAVESRPGQGSTFRLRVPRRIVAQVDKEAAP